MINQTEPQENVLESNPSATQTDSSDVEETEADPSLRGLEHLFDPGKNRAPKAEQRIDEIIRSKDEVQAEFYRQRRHKRRSTLSASLASITI